MAHPSMPDDPLQQRIVRLEKLRAHIDREIERLQSLRRQASNPMRPLKGLKLALVGPSFTERHYRSLLEPLGVVLLYVPSNEKLSQVYRICAKAHGILFITSFTNHSTLDHIIRAHESRDIPFRQVHGRGRERVYRAVLEMAPHMAAYRDLRG